MKKLAIVALALVLAMTFVGCGANDLRFIGEWDYIYASTTYGEKTTASAISLYDVVYYSDGLKVYKYIDNESVEVSIDEVINRNPERTTISIVTKNYVSVCYLKKCYINLCQ